MSNSFNNIFAAQVTSIQKHPNADRLRVITLNMGSTIISPVVCGAWNFSEGQIVALALPGAEIPNDIHNEAQKSFVLEKAEIRGVESQGMICAAFELGLTSKIGRGVAILKSGTQIGSQFTPEMIDHSIEPLEIVVPAEELSVITSKLEKEPTADSQRILRYLNMPDLSRTLGSPLQDLVSRITNLPNFSSFDIIQVPEVVPASISFDLFDFPANHPARSTSDTYYLNDQEILRTHTTVMWYYYLNDPRIKERIAQKQTVGSFCFGKVYRKDEIDRKHMNVFHQMDGWFLTPKTSKLLTTQDLEEVLSSIAISVFGKSVKYRFNPDTFPYTDPSLEMEIDLNGSWVEVLGCGVVKGSVLEKLGVDPEKYNGWAFGFGLERLAILSMALPDIRLLWSQDERVKKQLKLGHKFTEVSKYPPVIRDISFIVSSDFIPNNYFDLIRDIGTTLVEEVELVDKYENPEKFGEGKVSYTYRIYYRSPERTLTATEIEPLQEKLYAQTAELFNAQLR